MFRYLNAFHIKRTTPAPLILDDVMRERKSIGVCLYNKLKGNSSDSRRMSGV